MTPADADRAQLCRRDPARLRRLARIDRMLDTMDADIAAGNAAGRVEEPMRGTTARAFAAALLKRAVDAIERLEDK